MERRELLRKIALGTSGTILLPSFLSSCGNDDDDIAPVNTDKSVIVIGAGISGIAAAKMLKDKGFKNIIVLEGSNRMGGRIWTDNSGSIPIDLGASWIHGKDGGNPITAIAQNANASTFITDDDKIKIYDTDGSLYTDGGIDTADATYDSYLSQITAQGDVNKSFEEVLLEINSNALNDRLIKYQLSAYTEFDSGADITDLSSLYHDNDEKYPGADLLMTNGYIKVVAYLAEGLDIRYNQKVSEIDYAETQTKITTNQGNFNADFVVVSVPLGVLKKGIINFSPVLSAAKHTALSRMAMGTNNKVALFFEEAFWDTSSHYIGFTPETKGKYNYFLNFRAFSDNNVLMTFAFGGYGVAMEQNNEAQITADIMEHLTAIYGAANVKQPTKVLITNWDSNPLAHGAYTYIPKGASPADLDEIAAQIDDKIFFAGEHTTEDYIGTVHGAYLTGNWAAEAIIDVVNK